MQVLKVAVQSAFSVLALALLSPGFAAAPAPSSATSSAPFKMPELKYERYTLPNGLTVLTHEDHRLPLVAVDVWYHVGPLNERPGRTGFAHLFEHMMFEGSAHVKKGDFDKYTEGTGGTGVNGTTNFDRTNYFETMPSNQLERALWLESDRMGFLLEGLDRVGLTNQRDVVRNERRQSEGRPYYLATQAMFHLLFPKDHPYYAVVLGSHADIEAARINDVREFHQQFYTPNNATIAIAGDFDQAQLKALLTKYFAPIPAGPKVEPVAITTPPIMEQKRATVTDTVKLSQINVAFLMPGAYTPGDPEGQILGSVLGGAKVSRLDKALVYDHQIAQQVSCGVQSIKLASVFVCTLTAKPGVKIEDLEAAFWTEVGKIQKDGPSQDEIDSARTVNLTRKIIGLQSLGGFGGIADTLNSYNQYTGDPGYLPKDIARFEAVTVASVKQAAVQYLNKNQAVVVTTVPGPKVVDDVPRSPENTDADAKLTPPYSADFEQQQSWRNTVPPIGPASTFHLPVPKTFSLKNGLKVYLVPDHSLPVVSAEIVSRAGGEANPVAKPGLADFTAEMLAEGTTTRSAEQLGQDAERIGTRIGVSASMDTADSGLTVLTNHSGAALSLLSDVILHPAFNTPDIERIRKQRITGIQQEGDSPAAIATRVGPRVLYGDHPYGFTRTGTVASVESISADDLRSFWSGHYGPGDSALVLAGDVTEAGARALAEQYFGSWPGAASGKGSSELAPELAVPAPPAAPKLRLIVVDKPGSPQTALYAYGLGVPATTPDLQAIRLMNFTLGASFESRINMNLREVHGYTYGASSRYAMYREGGPFYAGGLVRTDVTAAATKELMMELNRIRTDPPSADELKIARTASVQSIPGDFEGTGATAGAMTQLFLYGRPLDYFATLPEKLDAVTPEAVEQAAKTEVHPDQLVIVAVGDKTKIEPGLKDLNLAPIEYYDPLGNPIP